MNRCGPTVGDFKTHDCLRDIERAKLACTHAGNGGASTTLDLGIVNSKLVSIPATLTTAEIDEAFSLVWNRHCRTTIAATLWSRSANVVATKPCPKFPGSPTQ